MLKFIILKAEDSEHNPLKCSTCFALFCFPDVTDKLTIWPFSNNYTIFVGCLKSTPNFGCSIIQYDSTNNV